MLLCLAVGKQHVLGREAGGAVSGLWSCDAPWTSWCGISGPLASLGLLSWESQAPTCTSVLLLVNCSTPFPGMQLLHPGPKWGHLENTALKLRVEFVEVLCGSHRGAAPDLIKGAALGRSSLSAGGAAQGPFPGCHPIPLCPRAVFWPTAHS